MAKRGRQDLNRALGKAAWIGVLVLVGMVLAAIFWPGGRTGDPAPPDRVEVVLGGRTFRLELAISEEQVRKGLMGRVTLADDGGMLFIFNDEDIRSFWMHGCRIDLDIIFLDANGRIVSIHTLPAPAAGAPRNTAARCISAGPAMFTIELKAGAAEQLGLRTGQSVEMDWKRLKGLAR